MNLDEVLNYLYTLIEDPETRKYKYLEDKEKNRQRGINNLISEPEPKKLSHHSQDTSTFDNYRYKSKHR